jgi:hypothetical protein
MKFGSFFAFLTILVFGASVSAQTSSVLTAGLETPNKVIAGPANSLFVTEAGTRTSNTGRISIIDRTTGDRRTLIDGLPSALSFLGNPEGDPDGPSGIFRQGNTLYVTIGIGDSTLPGAGPGLETVNPAPSSPLFDSILEISLPKRLPRFGGGFTLTLDDQFSLAAGGTVRLVNDEGSSITIRLAADLPNYRPAPRPGSPDNVKGSHLYGLVLYGKTFYVADAGHNQIKSVPVGTNDVSILVTFPDRANPLFPSVGGPFIEAVPDNLHRVGNRLIVPLLTGFPFVPGLSEIRSVGTRRGDDVGLIPNLSSAIDVQAADTSESEGDSFAGQDNAYYTLEFSTDQLAGQPGRLRFYSSPSVAPVTLLSNLITPTSMALAEDGGVIYITNIGPGTVTKVVLP